MENELKNTLLNEKHHWEQTLQVIMLNNQITEGDRARRIEQCRNEINRINSEIYNLTTLESTERRKE